MLSNCQVRYYPWPHLAPAGEKQDANVTNTSPMRSIEPSAEELDFYLWTEDNSCE